MSNDPGKQAHRAARDLDYNPNSMLFDADTEDNIMIGSITTVTTKRIDNNAMTYSKPLGVVMDFDDDNASTSIGSMFKESIQYIMLALRYMFYMVGS